MAGMFLSGDPTFVSFAVGTMIAVFVAMVGSLTVLPAILSKLGDRIEYGRIPFLGRRRGEEGRIWGAILRPVLRRPARRGRRLDRRPRRPGPAGHPDAHRRVRHGRAPEEHARAGDVPRAQRRVPRQHHRRDRRPRADDTPQTRAAIARPDADGRAPRARCRSRWTSRRATTARSTRSTSRSPGAARQGSDHALDDAAERADPRHVGTAPRRRVRGHRPDRRLEGLHRPMKHGPARVRLRPALRLPAPAGGLPLHRGRRSRPSCSTCSASLRPTASSSRSSSGAGARTCSTSTAPAASPPGCPCSSS